MLEGKDEAFRNLEERMRREWAHIGVAWKDTVDVNVLHQSLQEVPVLSGALRESGRNDLISTGDAHVCEVGYGSESTPYALRIHEDLSIKHPIHVNEKGEFYNCQGKAKYLEDPIHAAAPHLPDELKKRLSGGV